MEDSLSSPHAIPEHEALLSDDYASSVSSRAFSVRLLMTSKFWQHHSFWMGSLLAVVASTLNLVETYKTGGMEEDDDDTLVTALDPFEYWNFYKGLMVGATCLFLLDSILHIRSMYRSSNREADAADGTTISSASIDQDDLEGNTSLWFASLFGVASAFDLCCSFLNDSDYPWPAYVFECLSVYLFGMAANFLLYTKRDAYRKQRCSLMAWGDCLFWIGTTTDVVVSVLDNPTSTANNWWSAIGGMMSSVLWLIDAIFYEMAGADIFDMEVLVEGRRIAIPHEDFDDHTFNGEEAIMSVQ
jgi:hypothetical protein